GLRSKIFRQVVQINQGKADALPRFFGQADGIIFKQAVRLELCGVALSPAYIRDQDVPKRQALKVLTKTIFGEIIKRYVNQLVKERFYGKGACKSL
ncbi:MAG: hypothetical protein UFA98_11365, partial [Ruminococcus sp.]|nr:hypothetical protein [Ruminococcus sp.]